MLMIDSKSDYVSNGFYNVISHDIEGGKSVEVYLAVCEVVRRWSSMRRFGTKNKPDRTRAREILGRSTISSIGLSLGRLWRDNIVYDSS